jgi:hypothetical protein
MGRENVPRAIAGTAEAGVSSKVHTWRSKSKFVVDTRRGATGGYANGTSQIRSAQAGDFMEPPRCTFVPM